MNICHRSCTVNPSDTFTSSEGMWASEPQTNTLQTALSVLVFLFPVYEIGRHFAFPFSKCKSFPLQIPTRFHSSVLPRWTVFLSSFTRYSLKFFATLGTDDGTESTRALRWNCSTLLCNEQTSRYHLPPAFKSGFIRTQHKILVHYNLSSREFLSTELYKFWDTST